MIHEKVVEMTINNEQRQLYRREMDRQRFDKVYFFRSNSFNLESFAAGDSIKGVVGFGLNLNS